VILGRGDGRAALPWPPNKWDGGDDLPNQPACMRRRPGSRRGGQNLMTGGQTTGRARQGRPSRSRLLDVPKLIGHRLLQRKPPRAMQDAAQGEIGNVKVTTDGPTEAKIDEQIKFIDNYITRGRRRHPVRPPMIRWPIAPGSEEGLVEGD